MNARNRIERLEATIHAADGARNGVVLIEADEAPGYWRRLQIDEEPYTREEALSRFDDGSDRPIVFLRFV